MTTYNKKYVWATIDYIYRSVSDDREYIEQNKNEFMDRCCKHDGISSNIWLKGDISEEAIESTARHMLNIYYYRLLKHLLNQGNYEYL